jgi:jagged-like protein
MSSEVICTKEDDACQNGGVCVPFPDAVDNFCECPANTNGNRCHQVLGDGPIGLSVCTEDGGECENGGSCVLAKEIIGGEEVDANYCNCPDGTFGKNCHDKNESAEKASQLEEAAQAAAEAAFAEAQDEIVCTEEGGQCQNGGFCVMATPDGQVLENYCVCPEDYEGRRCHGHPSHGDSGGNSGGDSGSDSGGDSGGDSGSDGVGDGDGDGDDAKTDVCTKDGNECLNGATCILKDLDNNIPANYCKCEQGFFGAICRGKHSTPPPKPSESPPTESPPTEPTKPMIPTKAPSAQSKCTKGGMECQNGGVCVLASEQSDMTEANYCSCPAGFSGNQCESEKACDLECMHGSSCRHYTDIDHDNSGDNDMYCDCVGDYKGKACEIPVVTCPKTSDDSKEMECLWGGQCISSSDETNSSSDESTNEYVCSCPKGRSGDHCEQGEVSTLEDYNGVCYADVDCLNGGLCIRDHDSKTTEETGMQTKSTQCLCALGWGGDNCESQCTSLNCQHGSSCRFAPEDITHGNDSTEGGAFCDCKDGFKGRECEIAVAKCPKVDDDDVKEWECLFGGECIFRYYEYECACTPGRTGDHCQLIDTNFSPLDPNTTGQPKATTSIMTQLQKGTNIVVVSVVVALFLLAVPCAVYFLGKNKRKNAAATSTLDAIDECLEGMEDTTTEETDSKAENGTNGHSNGEAADEDIFDYDIEGVVNVNLDENEPVQLGKDKQIV